jgi:hypothetical protein
MCSEENLEETGATCRLETPPRKPLVQSAEQTRMSAQSVIKPLHLHPCNTTVVHKLCTTDCEERLNFVNWYLHGVQMVACRKPHIHQQMTCT